jgi:MFS superfamily sulfate permease-like transporter
MWDRLKLFFNPIDGRYEDMKGRFWRTVTRDFTAGLIVAMVAIPLAMGFAMASGLKPEHGIVGGAIAGLIGALFGGSKYQVYGPTAAFIPVIAGIMAAYGADPELNPALYESGHAFLILAAIVAGVILMVMGLFGLGRFVALVPHSIVVGFTIGIAVTIALSQIGEVGGIKAKLGYKFFDKLQGIWDNLHEWNWYALALAVGTFIVTKYLLKISVYIPAPLIALGLCTAVGSTIWADKGLATVIEKYGPIPRNLLVFTPPGLPENATVQMWFDLAYFAVAIIFVSAVESLLCSRMADRLADNRGIPFNPNKELWGQGWVQVVVPLVNGFPHTGALARTATNIKLGAVTPLAGIFKCVLKLLLAVYLASYLELVPMASIAGILMYVAMNMVKPAEITQVLAHNRFHIALMVYTAIMVIVTDFLTGVLSAIMIYAVFRKFLDRPAAGGDAYENLSAAGKPAEWIERNGDTATDRASAVQARGGRA